jgi:hypothetical protein
VRRREPDAFRRPGDFADGGGELADEGGVEERAGGVRGESGEEFLREVVVVCVGGDVVFGFEDVFEECL